MTSSRFLTVHSLTEVDWYLDQVRDAARRVENRLRELLDSKAADPLELLRRLKFEQVGFHPVEDRSLNVVEQINQTWTYAVALAAARKLMALHPDAGAFRLAPGAHASLALDIMSEAEGLVGAETFAAVKPQNNNKLKNDLAKMAQRKEDHRYIFFSSPLFPETQRLTQFERDGVQVWSVHV